MAKEDATAVNNQVVADTTPTDSAPVENNAVVEDEFDGLGDVSLDPAQRSQETEVEAEEASQDESEADADGTDTTEQTQTEEKTLSPKSENRFQQLANDNRRLKDEIEALKAREAQFAQEQDLLNEVNPETGEYYSPQEVERIAFAQSREYQAQQIAQERYNLEVQQNQMTIANEASRAIQDYPEFDSNSDKYDPELTAQADEIMRQSILTDDNGNVVGATVSPYQLYKTIAEPARKAAEKANTIAQANAQKATEKMLANADTAPGVASTSSGDDLDDLFDKIKDVKFV